jgi:hypothetical protein
MLELFWAGRRTGFALAKLVFCHLNHAPVHFVLVIFELGSPKLFAWDSFKLQSS